MALVLAEEVKGRTLFFATVMTTDVSCGKLVPVGPESISTVVSVLLSPVDKDGVRAVDPERPVGLSMDGSTFASWGAGLRTVL